MKQYKVTAVVGVHGTTAVELSQQPQPVTPVLQRKGADDKPTGDFFQAFVSTDPKGQPVLLVGFKRELLPLSTEHYSVPIVALVDEICGLHAWLREQQPSESTNEAPQSPQEPPQPGNVIQMPGVNGIARPEGPKEPGE